MYILIQLFNTKTHRQHHTIPELKLHFYVAIQYGTPHAMLIVFSHLSRQCYVYIDTQPFFHNRELLQGRAWSSKTVMTCWQ